MFVTHIVFVKRILFPFLLSFAIDGIDFFDFVFTIGRHILIGCKFPWPHLDLGIVVYQSYFILF